ncbi:inositol oxygenase [Hesseltinella vesiculosa]|uniref:Inositol oxygenase n=1 Tax=Hesseltinella vesiculosa TaxID=101127 RepID=A0A1X2GG67_9FUNG|nr:inositol oxygenase [Hesseltinella vesiculosa]
MRNFQDLVPLIAEQTTNSAGGLVTWRQSKKPAETFRDYDHANDNVSALYRENHEKQTVAHVLAQKKKYCRRDRPQKDMSVWQVLEILDSFVDDSDPDTHLSQIMHAMQSAEAARKDDQPRWLILTALIHDLGKLLSVMGEPQWTVVGDTFPVGCAFSDKVVYWDYFQTNPDSQVSAYQSKHGIYNPHCGLDEVHMSFGHDEYLYHIVKDYLPEEASYVIRFHSFYSCHTAGAYEWLMNDHDHTMMHWVKVFNQYDLYSKDEKVPDVQALRPYYEDLIAEFFPAKIKW